MKSISTKISAFVLAIILVGCETEFVNPNSPTDEQVLTTRGGLFGLSVGIVQLYSTSGLRFVLEAPAVTTREVAANITLVNYIELEEGGADLINSNAHVTGMWATMLRINQMCSSVISSVGSVSLEEGTANSLKANALFFQALSIGNLAQNYEQVVIAPNTNNNAPFVTRQAGFAKAISLLDEAAKLIPNGVSKDVKDAVLLGNIDLPNAIKAYLARYNLFAGNYAAAISAAESVDISVMSSFKYDGTQNNNPIWGKNFNTLPRDNFGIDRDFSNDGRLAFHMKDTLLSSINKLSVEYFSTTGFFGEATSAIPVYVPGEMQLIIAEALVRQSSPDLAMAVVALNKVRTKTKGEDIFKLGAGLGDYTGAVTAAAILDEIYANRRAELFLMGVSLEDSRRFGIAKPSGESKKFTEPRNRNFYPYPQRERSNNSNTPADPTI